MMTPPHYRGMWDCARSLVKYYGVRSLGRGLLPTLVRSFLTNATFMTTYSYLADND